LRVAAVVWFCYNDEFLAGEHATIFGRIICHSKPHTGNSTKWK